MNDYKPPVVIYCNEDKRGVTALKAIMIMGLITVILSCALYFQVGTMSPEIYFYVDEPVVTDVTVEIDHGVTKTVPEIPLGKKVTWKDVLIDENGAVHYKGKKYPFLYYEGRFEYSYFQYGWVVENREGRLYLDLKFVSESNLLDFLRNKMTESGLSEHEIDYLLERIIENDMLDLSQRYLVINYIPMEDVDKAIKLTTSYDFSIMRRHFVISESNEPVDLQVPEFEIVEDTGFMIHETAINRI